MKSSQKGAWRRLATLITKPYVPALCALLTAVLFATEARYAQQHMRLKVDASDLLPSGHPKNVEYDLLQDTFRGSSRGFYVVVEAPIARLREVVPSIAERYEHALPEVDFVRYRIEREYFERNLFLFQTTEHLRAQQDYLQRYNADVKKLMKASGSLPSFFDATSDIIDGEQDLASVTDEHDKDQKLTRDVQQLEPFLRSLRSTLDHLAMTGKTDPHLVDAGIEDLLLRGWADTADLRKFDRELLVPEDIWKHDGNTLAVIWITSKRGDLDADFSRAFMAAAEAVRSDLKQALPDVKVHFTGGIASYNVYAESVAQDFALSNFWGMVSVLILLVIAFRAVTPFVLLTVLLILGTLGMLVFQLMLFDGVNMIATAGAIAIIGIGSDYGVIFLVDQRERLAELRRAASGKRHLKQVRASIVEAIARIGKPTTIGALSSAFAFLALTGAEVGFWVGKLFGSQKTHAESFQPMHELAIGGALGLMYCLFLMLVLLPAWVYITEWLAATAPARRLTKHASRLTERIERKRTLWIRLQRLQRAIRTDYEAILFRRLGRFSMRHRFAIMGGSLLLIATAMPFAFRLGWSTGQREVEPRVSEAVTVLERMEHVFGKTFENLLAYGSLADIRALHRRLEGASSQPETNLAEVLSLDDYLPKEDTTQAEKLALIKDIDRALTGVHAVLPGTRLVLSDSERAALRGKLDTAATALAQIKGGEKARAAALRLQTLLTDAAPLSPKGDWRELWRRAPSARARYADEQARVQREVDSALERRLDVTAVRALRARSAQLRALLTVHTTDIWPATDVSEGEPVVEDAVTLPRDATLVEALALESFVEDSSRLALTAGASEALDTAVSAAEAVAAMLQWRSRVPPPAPSNRARLLEATGRLRRSLQALRSFAAASGFASVEKAMPSALAAVDELLASVSAAGEGPARQLDTMFVERLFQRFSVSRTAAQQASPLSLEDVPASARMLFEGQTPSGETVYLARIMPRLSLLERAPFHQLESTVQAAIGKLRISYSGFELLLNVATDYLESTFFFAMLGVCLLIAAVVHANTRSAFATMITLLPVLIGTTLTFAFMTLTGIHVTIFTVAAVPIIVGVGVDSSVHLVESYWDKMQSGGRAAAQEVMAIAGKAVTLNALTTIFAFGAMMFGNMKGLAAMGLVLALGNTLIFVAALLVVPAALSILTEIVIPAVQFGDALSPRHWVLPPLRVLLGRWLPASAYPDPGLTVSTTADGIVVISLHRPPMNTMEAAMVCRFTQIFRRVLESPDYKGVVVHSGLPAFYYIEDDAGTRLLDDRGKPERVPERQAESFEPPPGYHLVGPVRPMGSGADLPTMMANPLNAIFTMLAARAGAILLWYARKPIIIVAEGDCVAGHFEISMYSNTFILTSHARVGAPEVKRGLTLPFGVHALTSRGGSRVAQQMMATGDLMNAADAVRNGLADYLVEDGDPVQFALELCRKQEFLDRVQQISLHRQYGPPIGSLVWRSIINYMMLLRTGQARQRIARFLSKSEETA